MESNACRCFSPGQWKVSSTSVIYSIGMSLRWRGSNGAGKTTVMIAAYVALLPDMSRLRFTNLGETGATGGDKGFGDVSVIPDALPTWW